MRLLPFSPASPASFASLASLALMCAATALAKPVWKPLFDVKSFRSDWHYVGDSTFWTVDAKDTSIVGFSNTTKTPHALLFSNRADYDQFTVKYAYRLKVGCSGFWFHSREKGTATTVEGPQVEIKREANELLEVGSIYTWPAPGWEVQHSRNYSVKVAPKVDEYQEVILTVKKPFIYVNVNGNQAIGETDAAALASGAKAAFNYTNSINANQPGKFALQVHEGYAIDVRFKNVMILEGCGDAKSAQYDGEFVQGFAKQPAVYQDNGSCLGTSLPGRARTGLAPYLGRAVRSGAEVTLEVSYPGPNSLEIKTLDGKSVFTGTAPAANVYRLSDRIRPGLYLAGIGAGRKSSWQRILIP